MAHDPWLTTDPSIRRGRSRSTHRPGPRARSAGSRQASSALSFFPRIASTTERGVKSPRYIRPLRAAMLGPLTIVHRKLPGRSRLALPAEFDLPEAWRQIRTALKCAVEDSTFEIWLASLEARE